LINANDGFQDATVSEKINNRFTSGGRVEYTKKNLYLTLAGYYQYGKTTAGNKLDEVDEINEYCPMCLAEYIMENYNKLEEAEYRGRKVSLGKPFLTPGGPKKRSVYVKNAKGNVVKVNFGDPNMRIKKSNPKRRKSFRARHNCSNPGPRDKARYWSCRAW
jgi:uncharacterized protein YutD